MRRGSDRVPFLHAGRSDTNDGRRDQMNIGDNDFERAMGKGEPGGE